MAKDLTKSLSDAIASSIRASKFCCGGTMSQSDPGIEVENVGRLKFPLKPKAVKTLVEQCQIAPFGKGTETIVDTTVRKTYELSPDRFRVSDEWASQIGDVVGSVASELGLPPDELQAELYKLLVYKQGGFFIAHRDSEKNDGMVASLIIALPNEFDGGTLIVRHPPSMESQFPFVEAAHGDSASYAAFYSNCEHEVRHVQSGLRICLCYNLILHPSRTGRGRRQPPDQGGNPLVASVHSWFSANPSQPLVFALEHEYTERGLSRRLLKGTDRSLADLVVTVSEEADCHVQLAHVSRHLVQFADDGGFRDWDRYRRRDRSRADGELEIGETYEDELSGAQWKSMSGKEQSWGVLPLELASIVSEIPVNDWKLDSEDYEGYTGNAGNTLDRWYHRAAIVIWPKSQHFTVLATAGPKTSIPLFLKLMSKLAKAAQSRKESLRADCIAFARAILPTWPRVSVYHQQIRSPGDMSSLLEEFRDQLVILNDPGTIVELLSQVALRDESLSLKVLIRHACREFGVAAIAAGLKALLTPPPNQYRREDLPVRNLESLAAVCALPITDTDSPEIVRDLCRQAVSWFCTLFPEERWFDNHDDTRKSTTSEEGLPILLRALFNCGCSSEVSSVIGFVESNPDQFRLEHCHVPTLKELVPWSTRRFHQLPGPLQSWLIEVRSRLETATSREPLPPLNWRRASDVSCKCEYCDRLKSFLQDPTAEVGRIRAREETRSHLVHQISRQRFDVTHRIEKLGNPHTLVLTKTQDSFDRKLKRYQLDKELLKSLPSSDC